MFSLQLSAEFDRSRLLVIEGVVVEENFLQAREILLYIPALVHDVVGRAQSPAVAGMRLRPQAERAQRRASPRRVERKKGSAGTERCSGGNRDRDCKPWSPRATGPDFRLAVLRDCAEIRRFSERRPPEFLPAACHWRSHDCVVKFPFYDKVDCSR